MANNSIDIWNSNFEWYKNISGEITRIARAQDYTVDSVNDIYFKIQKAFSGVTFTYSDNLDDIYKYDLLMGDGYSLENFFNEYDVIDRYLLNYIQVDVASVINVDITQNIFEIDGVTLKPNHKVLLKDQMQSEENNVYVVSEKNYLIKSDYLSTTVKSDKFKVYVKLGDVNYNKQWFLMYNQDGYFPTSDEPKSFIEKHSYIIKHRISYNIDAIPSNSANTHKVVFADYDLARKMNNKNAELWTGFTIDVSSVSVGDTFSVYYYDKEYIISIDGNNLLYDDGLQMLTSYIYTMTGYTTYYGECYASTDSVSHEAFKVFDYNSNTSWRSDTVRSWLVFKFIELTEIWKYTINFSDSDNTDTAPKDWHFEGSIDGEIWNILDTRSNQTLWSGDTAHTYREFEIENSKKYKYYRVNIIDNNGGDYTAISNLYLYNVLQVVGENRNYEPYATGNIENIYINEYNYDTLLKTANYTNLSVDDYIEVEFIKSGETYCKFNSTIKSIHASGLTITDVIPTWVLNDLNTATGLTWIIRDVQKSFNMWDGDISAMGIDLALKKSYFSKYIDVSINDGISLVITPKVCDYNLEFDYGSLSFNYNGDIYRFTTQNSYINYNLKDFLNGVSSTIFTPNMALYNSNTIIPISQYYLENHIIRVNTTNATLKNFKNYTYVNISGVTHTSKTLIIELGSDYILLEKPINFDSNEFVSNIQNISKLSEISDLLYDVYKNIENSYYIPKNDNIIKNVYLSYGDILNKSVVWYYAMGLLTEISATNRDFVLKLYNVQNDDNLEFKVGYRPIEIMDVGIDKKTMIPKSLIYPDFFTYTDKDYSLDGDYNVIEGDEMLTEYMIDENVDMFTSIVIDDNI